MSTKTIPLRRIPLWAMRSLTAACIAVGVGAWSLQQRSDVDEVNLTRSARNLPLALPRPTADDWPSELGFDGTGGNTLDWLPRQVNYGSQPTWQITLPGPALGSPCAWGDVAVVPIVEPADGRIALLAVNRHDGQQLWQAELRRGLSMEPARLLGGATPACDGQHVFLAAVIQGRLALFAVDLQGRPRWERDMGPMHAETGRLISPLLHENLVLVAGEHRGIRWNAGPSTAHLTAVHRLTGEIIWRIRCPNHDSLAKPAIAEIGGRRQLVIPAPGEIAAYNPDDGSLLWTCRWPCRRTANSVAWNNDTVFATTRDPQPMTIAIRADGSGDVTATHVVWQTSAAGSSLQTPRCVADSVICLQENGLLLSLETSTGKVQWRKQLSGSYSAQPILANGELWCLGVGGSVLVDLNQRGKALAELLYGAPIVGQPVATRRQVLLRTTSGLISLSPDDGEPPLVNTPPDSANRL